MSENKVLPRIFLISGKKFHGKDTLAQFLLAEMAKYDLVPYKMALADPLKKAAQTVFLLSDRQIHVPNFKEVVDLRWGMTPREILQKFGTEVGRQIDMDVWVKNLIFRIEDWLSKSSQTIVFVTDVRYPNEIDRIRKRFGDQVVALRIIRKGLPVTSFDNHPSETSLDDYSGFNWTVNNQGTIQDLKNWCEDFVKDLLSVFEKPVVA